MINAKNNVDIQLMGSHETCLKRNLDYLGVEPNAFFGGEVDLVGNYWHKILVDYREGKKSVLAFLENNVELYKKHDEVWEIISKIDKFFSTPSPSPDEAEKGATLCEEFGETFPVNFPERQITTKIHTLSFVFPKFIREQNICYKMLQLEQGGERLHAILNRIEKKLENISNPSTRYWLLLKEYENLRRSDLSIFAKTKRGPYKKRKTVKAKKVTFRWKKK